MTLQTVGNTTNFTVAYDDSIVSAQPAAKQAQTKANLIANCNFLLGQVEAAFTTTTGWFATDTSKFGTGNRQQVDLDQPDNSGAFNNGYGNPIHTDPQSQNSSSTAGPIVSMLWMAEWSEVLMSLTSNWNAGDSSGEGLSQFSAGTIFLAGHNDYYGGGFIQDWLNGTGTTIAIVDAYGSTTIAHDAQAFSAATGLPPINLTVIGTPTESNFSGDANSGWATETTLDVEWVHAVAPGAKIVLVVTPTNSNSDLFNGIVTAASTPGVVAISNSWDGFDIGVAGDGEFYRAADSILQEIGAAGISVNFSTGDSGDNSSQLGGLYTSTGWPASSPFATGIGGVSVALDQHKHIAWQTSWGTELTEIADTVALGSPPIDTPNNEGFDAGGTGGFSDTYPKPFWQFGVPGDRRGTPDISWVADPFTGVEIIFTADAAGDLGIEPIGGTSVACPMFTALWGIATQRAHHLLGQAAPHLYRISPESGAINDIVSMTSQNNVTGTIEDAGGTNPIRATELAAPLNNQPRFISALYNSPHSTRWFVLVFGVDSTLQAGPGWDQATGLGSPNGWAFVQAVAGDGDGQH